MNIALVGCGYVADFYLRSARYHPELNFIGVFDHCKARLNTFSQHYSLPVFDSLDTLLLDPKVDIVLNLTNPNNHYAINSAALSAGKHVYCEKPLAMTYPEANKLVQLAHTTQCYLSSAPCSVLSNTAQTIQAALRENRIGKVRLIYANFDAGMSAKSQPWLWQSASGAPWPAKDEFEVGCTYEHAGYLLTWLAAFFGPAKKISAFAATLAPEKGLKLDNIAPDFSVGCLEYANKVIARITCSLAAPLDRSLTIVGDDGTLYVKDVRDDNSPVYLRHQQTSRLGNAIIHRLNHYSYWIERFFNWIPSTWGNYYRLSHRLPYQGVVRRRCSAKYKPVDFCLGLSALVRAIESNQPCVLSSELGAHIVELIEVLQYPERFERTHTVLSGFDGPILS